MKVLHKNTLTKLIFSFFFILCSNLKAENLYTYPIDLSVYDGQGALLIEWVVDDSIQVKEIRVFGKKISDSKFKSLAIIDSGNGRYLDEQCEPGERYYYKVEILDLNNKIFTSDIKRPSFGTCLINKSPLFEHKSSLTMRGFIIHSLIEKIELSHAEGIFAIENFLNSNLNESDNNWIEKFPLEHLFNISRIIDEFNNLIKENNLLSYLLLYESAISNYMLLTHSEWQKSLEFVLNELREDWGVLYEQYPYAVEFYNTLPPARIISSSYQNEDRTLNIFPFHPQKLIDKEFLLLNGNQYIRLGNSEILDRKIFSVVIPNDWSSVNLLISDTLIQKCPIIKDENIIYALKGDLLPVGSNKNNLIKVDREKTDLWLNEVQWINNKKKLRVEFAFKPDLINKYFLKDHLGNIIWEYSSDNNFDDFFSDSSFILNNLIEEPILISLNIQEKESLRLIEYIFLDTVSFLKGRELDLYSWRDLNAQTFGKTNNVDEENYDASLIPEVFVLYQNYPNPFNGQTRIAFDLLNDAIINLYVADATGRIHDKLIDEAFITSGSYNYSWSGENRSTGIYFITLQAQVGQIAPAIMSRKMIYLK